MPYIDVEKSAPTAETAYSINQNRPLGEPMVLTRITVTTYQSSKFCFYHGMFRDAAEVGNVRSKHIGLFGKIVPEETGATLGRSAVIFEGRVPWPQGLELLIQWRSQTAVDVVTFNIMFERIVEREKMPRWGE